MTIHSTYKNATIYKHLDGKFSAEIEDGMYTYSIISLPPEKSVYAIKKAISAYWLRQEARNRRNRELLGEK